MKRIFLFIFGFFIFTLFSPSVFAENFFINSYDVQIRVNKDKTVNVVEDIDAYFTNSSHGIFRDIPFPNASISDINVSERFETTYSGNNVNIKIGNPDRYITGKHHYRISYKYAYHDNKNEFYHNIIGTKWPVEIKKVYFYISMPEDINPSKVGLSIGKEGVKGFNGGAKFFVRDDRKILGKVERILLPYEGVTIRVEVPDGYFTKYVNHTKNYVVFGILLLVAISVLTWFVYGKDEPVIPVVNFYPPKGLNAAEVELLYKGKASIKGLVALLIELAQKGYIKIIDEGNNSFSIEKIKDYDGNIDIESDYITALFKKSANKVRDTELAVSKTFYLDCNKIVEKLNKKRDKIFVPSSIGFPLQALMFLCLAGLLFLTVYTLFSFQMSSIMINFPFLLFPLIAILVLVLGFMQKIEDLFSGCFILVWALLFGGMPMIYLLRFMSIENLPVVLFGIAGLIISAICTYQLPKRNKFGQRLLNNLLGLKHFIEVAEKHRLEQLVNEEPEYFYNVLPSAYILEVSDKWISKFENIITFNPDWYSGDRFNTNNFNYFSNRMNSVSVPSVANGGVTVSSSSSGGGGHSGGGGGGGGGGSW
ncbi:DUF2207 domain-containing protein [bacterium]|nr:DUF2207 domain-containing protein [bacterium]